MPAESCALHRLATVNGRSALVMRVDSTTRWGNNNKGLRISVKSDLKPFADDAAISESESGNFIS